MAEKGGLISSFYKNGERKSVDFDGIDDALHTVLYKLIIAKHI